MSFFFAITYLVVEYMRPQAMYESWADFPLGLITVSGFLIAFFLEWRGQLNANFMNVLISAYLVWMFLSFLLAFDRDIAWKSSLEFFEICVIYFLLINTINDRRKLYVFVVVLLLLNFKYAQFAARIWVSNGFYSDPRGLNEGGGIGSGFFRNPNDFGVALNSVFGIGYSLIQADTKKIGGWLRMQWFHLLNTGCVACAIMASSSRGSLIALGSVSLAIWKNAKRKAIGFALLGGAVMVAIALIPNDNWARFQAIGEDNSSQSRLVLWSAGIRMANDYPVTGVGPGNFVYANQIVYQAKYRQVQHNVFIQAASELGYPGLILLIGMMGYCFYNQRRTRELLRVRGIEDRFLYGLSYGLDYSMIGFAVNGFFITVLYYPFFWMLLVLSVSLVGVARQSAYETEQSLDVKSASRGLALDPS